MNTDLPSVAYLDSHLWTCRFRYFQVWSFARDRIVSVCYRCFSRSFHPRRSWICRPETFNVLRYRHNEMLDIYMALVRFFVFSAQQGFGDRVRGLLHQVTRLRQRVLDWFHGVCDVAV